MRGAIFLLFLLIACAGDKAARDSTPATDDTSGGDSRDSAADTGTLNVHLSGAAAKGPMIRGSDVSVIALDAAGTPTGDVFSTYTDDDAGSFSLDISLDGPARLEANGYYYNEATGALSTAPITLRSYHTFTEDGETSAYINLFTHLCSGRIEALLAEGESLPDAIATAESEAQGALTIAPAGFDPGVEGGAMNLLGGDSDGNAWLFGLSVVLSQRALNAVGEEGPLDATLSETINSLSDDLSDGGLEGDSVVPTGAELYALQATIDADAVMDLLAARFADIGSSAEVPDLHRVFDLDLDGIVDLDDPDADGDGVLRPADGGADCEDYAAAIYPGAAEDPTDGLDSDCTVDRDGDGYLSPEDGGADCDDEDADTWPGAEETWYDGVDQACDGDNDGDQDGDGDDALAAGGADCDDTDAAIHPRATESCATEADDDCDGDDNEVGAADCTDWYLDLDGDGYGVAGHQCACEGAGLYTAPTSDDCDDTDATVSPVGWPCTEELVTTDATAKLTGRSSGDLAGQLLWMGDDLNLDGNADLVVSAYYEGSGKGSVYVVFGPVTGTRSLSTADLSFSDSAYSFVGYWVGAAGDLDGDGHDDLGFLASKGGFFGFDSPVGSAATLSSPDVRLSAETSTDYLTNAAGGFDFDGDGQDDVAVADANWGPSATGATYVALGPLAGTASLASADLILRGEAEGDSAGIALARGGDTDGDGIEDLIVGAHYNGDAGTYAGAAYLVVGGTSGTASLSDADAIVTGTGATEWVGDAVAGQGDADGDGYGDLVIGASRNGSNYQGAAWLMSGPLDGTLTTAAATASLEGAIEQDYIGGTLGELRDLNGDAAGDLVIGALNDFSCGKKTGTGSVYVYFGPVSGALSCAHADVLIAGATVGGRLSRGLASVGDTDGDGLGELFVGASLESTGNAYLFPGTAL